MSVTLDDLPLRHCAHNITITLPQSHIVSTDRQPGESFDELASQKTPTRDSFTGLAGQRPLPGSFVTSAIDNIMSPATRRSLLDRNCSHRSTHSIESQDVSMGDDDEDGQDGSDTESAIGDSERPSKKKKGQRFFCTDFPPCQLSFTRSEHLARHIRKHTGERPFQCHCLRRFSRLDNLRQHAQTVHVNEEIPGDSLAATGTRFQRQIRTDRVRPPNRPRTSTMGSQTSSRGGHSRNMSGSSVVSISSEMVSLDDGRRRPPPLAMAPNGSPGRGLVVDTFNSSPQFEQYYNASPSDRSTPTSVFSPDLSSPRASGLQSPNSIMARSQTWDNPPTSRRLSVPSGYSPYNPSTGYHAYTAPTMTPLASSTASTFSSSGTMLSSPTSSAFSEGCHESAATAEAERRRRTWHPSTYPSSASRPATSGLSYYRTPDAPQPIYAARPAANQGIRLPGIDSFDRAHTHPIAPPRRRPSPMEIDQPPRSQATQDLPIRSEAITPRSSWDVMNQNLTKLDLAHATPARDGHIWRNSTGTHQTIADPRPGTVLQSGSFISRGTVPPPLAQTFRNEPPTQSTAQPATPRRKKRHAWYNGPLPSAPEEPIPSPSSVHRTSPEGSSSSDGLPTPSTSAVAEYHPAIVHSNGYVEFSPPGITAVVDPDKTQQIARQVASTYQSQQFGMVPPPLPETPTSTPRLRGEMNRLEALAAAATSEEQTANRSEEHSRVSAVLHQSNLGI